MSLRLNEARSIFSNFVGMAENQKSVILNSEQLERKLDRLAYEVYEQNFQEQEIYICGIMGRGFMVAVQIADRLRRMSHFDVSVSEVILNKEHPENHEILLNPDLSVKGKCVILCDDVLYTGKTLAYAAIPFMTHHVRKLQCLVLIHRNHLTFPIQPRFIGMKLATTLQEHISVNLAAGIVELK